MKIIFGFREFVFFSDQELKLFKIFYYLLLQNPFRVSITLEQSSMSTLTKWHPMFLNFVKYISTFTISYS